MSEKKKIIGTAALSAFFVLGVGAPLMYFGLPTIIDKIIQPKADTPSVIIELKAELKKEIQSATAKSKEELQMQLTESEKRQSAILTELRQVVDEVRSQQEKMVAKLDTHGPRDDDYVPGKRHDTFNQTIFFPLGKVKGPIINSQLKTVITKLRKSVENRNCVANVLGFSDTLGGDLANLKLSQDRAAYIANELAPTGVKLGNIKGWGERWLNEHTPDATKNDKNRRVVIELDCDSLGSGKLMPSS